MNNLESAEKKRKRLLEIIAIIIVLCIFLVLVFAANLGEGDGILEDGSVTTSVDTNDETEEILVKGDKNKATVATGANFTIALDSEGNVWSWGQNNKGQLGNGTLNDTVSKQPVLLENTDEDGNHLQLSNVKQIAAGEFHAVALTETGKVYMWGYNYYGQAGSETKRVEVYPQLISTPNDVVIKEIGAGADYTLMVTSDGKVLGIGDSSDGQLGYYNDLLFTSIRDIEELKDPSEVQLSNIKKIATGYNHIVALDNNGLVWTWGDTLGSGFEFTDIKQVSFPEGEIIKEIEAGKNVSMALSESGKVYTWNINNNTPTEVDLSTAYGWDYTTSTPTKVTLDEGIQIRTDETKDNIAIINQTYYIISADNKVYSWGLNTNGQTGIGNTSTVTVPTELKVDTSVEINKEIDKVTSSAVPGINTSGNASNYDTAYAINADGYVLGWGYAGTDIVDAGYTDGSNTFKLLGDGTRYVANYIGSISVKNIVGDDIVLDITAQGLQAGKDKENILNVLDKGGYVTGGRVNLYNSSISENSKDSLTIKSVDEIIASYDEKTGILVGKQQGRTLVEVASSKNTIYLNVEVIGDNVAFAKIESKDNFTVALKTDGTVWAWGYNSYLGIVDSEHSNYTGIVLPVQVKGLENVKNIAVGTNFVLVLKTDGTVWTWGYNNYGQLGNGTTTTPSYKSILTVAPELTQVQRYQIDTVTTDEKILMPTPVVKDDAGEDTVYSYTENGVEIECYLNDAQDAYTDANGNIVIKKDTDGKLYKWENGDFATREVTRNVIGDYKLENITAISAGENYALALDESGKVWSWGYNGYRQLGLGNTTTSETRAKEVNLTNINNAEETIKQIEAGKRTSYILTTSGNVYAFGYNYPGDYQCGMSGNYYIPTKITTLNRITKISTSMGGRGSAFALTVNGKVYAFGYNYGYPRILGLDKVVDISGSYGSYGAIVKFADGTSGYWTGNSVNNSTITKLKSENGTEFNNVMLIAGTSNYYTVVKTDGTVWTTGSNSSYGRLGNRTTSSVSLPTLKCISYPYTTLSENEVTLKVGETSKINATYNYGFNLLNTEKEIEMTYTSSNEEIAKVSENTITAVSAGTTYVTAIDADTETTLRVKVNVLAENEVTMPNISVGYLHTVAVKTDGTVWGWGRNSYGELGQTSTTSVKSPTKLSVDVKVKGVAAGLYETLMVTEDGKVLAMGYNNYGLGDNTNTTSKKPVTVKTQKIDEDGNIEYVDLENIVKVTTFNHINLALDNTGKLYAWGYDGSGYAKVVSTFGLEVKDISERLILTEDGRVWEYDNSNRIIFKDGLENIVQVSSSAYSNSTSYGFYMALDAKGNVYTWVRNSNSNNLVSGTETTAPSKVTFADGVNIVDIEAGLRVAYAKDEAENVYTWGRSASAGTLGLGTSVSSATVPTKIESLNNIEVIAASKRNSYNRTFVSKDTGTVYGFGQNSSYSLLGNFDTTNYYYEPTQVGQSYLGFVDENENEITRTSIEKGKTATVETRFIDSFNIRNRNTGSAKANCTWRVINADLLSILGENGKGNTIKANSILGEAVVIAEEIDEDGNKTGAYAKLYVDVVEPNTLVAPKMESVGNHTIALKADGTVWAWGSNVNYRNTSTIVEPTQIRIAKQVEVQAPVAKVNEDGTPAVDENGKQIYVYKVNDEEKECYQSGNNYTDLSGKFVIRTDNVDGKLYLWDAEENSFALEDLVDSNGEKIVVVDIATSNKHTLLLTSTGDVYSFGYNGNRQLGYSTVNTYSYLPEKVNELRDIVKIAVGDNYSLALDKYGNLWTFGYIHYHMSNDSYCYIPINSIVPKQLTKVKNTDITKNLKSAIDITNEYIVTKDGEVFAIGLYNKTLTAGTQVPGITGNVIKATRTSNNGNGHTAFLTEDGEVFTIGAGAYGQLGNDGYANSNNTAVQVLYGEENVKLTNIRDINVGQTHTMAIDKNGKLYTWGSNGSGELRSSTVEVKVKTARAFEVKQDSRIADAILVSGGNGFTVVADSTGYAYAWGNGTSGQLGNRLAITSYDAVRIGTEGATLSTNHITLQENGDSARVTGVAKLLNLIYEQSIDVEDALSNDSSVATTSAETDTDVITINPVKSGTTSVTVKTKSETGKEFENIIQVTVLPEVAEIADDIKLPADRTIEPMTVSGKSHTLILKADGTVWAYGDNAYGQTGAKDENGKIIRYSDKAIKVEFPEGTASIIGIAVGDLFSVALDAEGNVWTWGYNANGRLGIGSSDYGTHNEPTKVLSNIVKVEAGSSEVIALNKNGYVYTWGKNNGGSLGIIGTNADQHSPVRINNIAGAIDVAAGEYHAMILTSDGEVYTTGRNTSGQLGRNVSKSDYFEKVEIDAKIAYIEANNRSSIAIDTLGKLWVWGENSNGQLGLEINDNRVNEPTQVTTFTERVQRASIGENHIHVVTTDGKLYVAGSNNHGQLGIGASVEKTNKFVQVTSLGADVINSNAGTTYSTVIKKDGTVFGFGDYDLAKTNFTDSYEPVMITNTTLYLDEQEIVLNIDGTYKVNANGQYRLNVLHKDNSEFTYSSANEEIATVDEFGVVTGVSVGTTTINVKDENEDGKTSTVLVKVIPKTAIQAPSIEGGDKFTIVTNESGESYVFGKKDNIAKTDTPSIANNSLSFNKIRAGKDFAVAINKDNTVWAWGDNSNNQLGLEDVELTDKMSVLNTDNINNVVQLDAGENHTIALDELGIIYVWGENSNGQLGIKQPVVDKPTVIRPINNRVISVSAGGIYSAIVDITGKAYIIQNGVATEIKGIEGAIKVAIGKEYTIVLTNRGTAYKVVNAMPTVYTTITGLNNIVDISANNDTFMCLSSDKILYTFGSNENGKLGLGRLDTAIQAPRKAAEDVFTMGAGYNNTYYINTEGQVLSAGLNTSGELGNGTSANEDATTYTSSNVYVQVGDQEFKLTPKTVRVSKNWKILVGEESLKETSAELEKTKVSIIDAVSGFNVFRNKTINLDNYEYAIDNEAIAEISDPSILEITAKDLGTAVLTITNKITKEQKELTIKVVTEDLLRIENMYINDTIQDYIAEPDASEDNKFIVNVEGSNPTGILNIELEFNDTIKVEDEAGNVLTATYDSDTNSYQIVGLDLTKSVQELKITLTSEDGKTYEFTLLIFNELIVKVNDVMLSAKDVLNKETLATEKVFTKYVDPKDTTAKVEISIDNIENKIQLETVDGTIIKTTNPTEVLEIADLSLPDIENRFIVKILNDSGKVEKQYVLRITKSSIETIKVKDISEIVTADRTVGEGEYLEEFTTKINDANEFADITIELGNKDIATIEIDGVDKTDAVSGSKLVISKELETDENKTTDVIVKITTNEGYTEQYIIKVSTISSNNNMDYIELTAVEDVEKNPAIKARKVSDSTYEIVLHDEFAQLDTGIRIKAVTESKKATISFNGGRIFLEQGKERALQPKKVTDNQYEVTMIVKAENGDTKSYTLYIYKQSENTEIGEIKVIGTPSNYENNAIREEGTNNYIGKVVKTDTGYKLSIDLIDEYSVIESITINDEELEGLIGEKGKYTIDIDSDKLGETISIKVKAEYGNETTYTLTLQELDDNAEFESVKVDAKLFNNLETDTELEAQVKSTEEGILTVKAQSAYATVKVYETNPSTDNAAKAIAEGKESVELAIPFNGAKTKTLYLEITSEDGQNKTIRTLTATKTSDNTNITSVTLNDNKAILDTTDENKSTYTINVSEATTEATIVITAEDSNATVQIDEVSNKGKVENTIDILDVNEIKFTVTSEEGTDKNYTLKLNKLSADTSFTKEFQDSNGDIVAEDIDFVQDATDNLKYKVEVLDNLGDIKLVIKPNDSKATVVIKDELGNVIEDGVIPSNISKNIKVEITSADGNTTTYTIEVVSKHHMLETAQVTANSVTTTLSKTDIANLYKEVRVHPDSTKATIFVEVNSSYSLTGVNANVKYMDKDGNPIHDDVKDEDIEADITGTVSSSRKSTFDVNLLSDKATVQVTMTISTGETQVLTLDIVKGSTKAKLDYVELVGKDSNDTTKQDYTNISISEMIVDSEDNEFSIEAVAKENGTVKIYKLAEETENWETVDLSTMTEIENKSEITLTGDNSIYVIEVTSEFGGNKARYQLTARKQHSDASLKDLTIKLGNAISEDENNDIIKKLSDFGKFTYNEVTKTYELTAWIPGNIDSLSVYDLVSDSEAKIEWTDISGTISNKYTQYSKGDIKELSKVELVGNIEKYISIKVTAEDGKTTTNYSIKLETINSDMSAGDFSVYNVTDDKDVAVENKKAEILQSVQDIKVTGKVNNGAVSLKVLAVNGKTINETIVTSPEFITDSNELEISLNKDYTYTDEDGTTYTIPKEAVKTIVVERQLKSLGSHLYPDYYDEEAQVDTLTITRLMTDTSITIKYLDNGVEKTITSADFGEALLDKEENEVVRDLTIYLSSAQNELVINNIKADNEYVEVSHRQTANNTLYSVELPYKKSIVEDKASTTEEIRVVTENKDSDITYRVKFVKLSADNNINTITVNDYKTEQISNTDEFTHTILSTTNKLAIGVTDIEENATVKVYISAINDTNVVVADAEAKYSEIVDERKNATTNIYAQLLKALADTNISRQDLNKITVKIEVQAQDSKVDARVYTLNIAVENSNLISINGINVKGEVGKTSQLLAEDFNIGNNPYSTAIIKVPADVDTVELTDITYTDEEHAILTDAEGNVLTNKSLTVNVQDNLVTTAKIVITLNENRQEFNIRIQKKSTDTSIREVIADKDRTDTINETSKAYELDVRSTINPEVQIILNNPYAKVISTTVENLPNAVVSDIEDNKFTISKVAITRHQDTTEEEPIIVKVKVQAENEKTEPQEYTIKLTRKHTETGLAKVTYEYDKNTELVTNTLDYTSTEKQKVQIISSDVEGIRISEIVPVCSKATVYVQSEDGTKEELDITKLYKIEEGQTKKFTIIVKSEFGDEKPYTFSVRKLSSNTGLDGVKVNGINAVYDVESKLYNANIRVDNDADIEIIPANSAIKIKGTPKVYIATEGDLENVKAINVGNTTFGVEGLLNLYVDDATEDNSADVNRYIIVKFVVEAEDTDVTKEYTIRLTRQHIETALSDVGYNYTEVIEAVEPDTEATTKPVEGTITLNTSDVETILVGSSVEFVNINKITPACKNATVVIKVDGKEVEQTEDGFNVELLEETSGDGCIKTVQVFVTAESKEITSSYTFYIARKATNASLSKVIVNGEEVERTDLTEENIEAIYKVNVKDTDKSANIEAISANISATVSIDTDKFTAVNNNKIYDEKGTYDLSSETAKEVEVLIKVQPQDENIEAKTYKLIMVRQYNNTSLTQITIKPTTDGVDDEAIIKTEEDFKQNSCVHRYGGYYTATGRWVPVTTTVHYWSEAEIIEIPTEWYNIAFSDIVPTTPDIETKIVRINGATPAHSGIIAEYDVDESFVMPEGEKVYFKIITTAESGSTNSNNPYVVTLYKKATSTNASIVIDGITRYADEDGIYRVITNVEKESMNITVNGTNNLDVKNTVIETTSGVSINKKTTGELSKQVTFSLKELNQLDYIDEKVITLTIKVQPEDNNIEAKEYTIEITREHTSAEIEKVIGDGKEAVLDTQMSHYNYINKKQVDNTIYTLYIDKDVTEVSTDIIAESQFANIYLNEDYETSVGVGKVEGIKVEIKDTGITEVKVRIVAEDGSKHKDYRIWYIKKSDDASIKELYVDGAEIPAKEDGNYEIKIPDTVKSIDVKMIPNYEFANVSINGQPYKWQEAQEIINEYTLKGERVEIKLQVNIPEEQSSSGIAINNTKYLYINRVSTSNEIAEITTDNNNDSITPGNSPQYNKETGMYDKYTVNIDGNREFVDLRIVPVSLGATLTIYDLDGVQLTDSSIGTLYLDNIEMNDEDKVTFRVNVAPEEGEAKDYYIDIVPKKSQAELIEINVGGHDIEVIPGVYEYPVYNLALTEIGAIRAKASDSQALVNIYTKEHPEGIGNTLGSAIVSDVNFEQAIIVQITVMSPNRKNQNTYKLYFKDVSDDSSLKEVSYNITGSAEDKVVVEMTESNDSDFAGEYVIQLNPEVENVDIRMIATDEISIVGAEGLTGNPLRLPKDVSSMTEDIVIDVVVTAESTSQSKYKVIIKKPTAITGKVITENWQDNYENVPVQILDNTNTEVATTVTQADGTFKVSVPVGEGYKVVIKKPGYLTYTITDIPVVYGVRTYVGIANLLAGEVAGDDEYIELRDLVQVNKKARAKSELNNTDKIYDLNEDGTIDSKDVSIVIKNYDKTADTDSTFKYTRYVNIKGLVIDKTGVIVPKATIELGNRAITRESGEFDLEDIKIGDYTLTVKNLDGNIIGQNNISIVEGNEYVIESNTITITPNTYEVDLQVIVNGTKAIISKCGEEPDVDMIEPIVTINKEDIEITNTKVRVTLTGEDKNLSRFELYTEDGTLIASKTVSGVESYEATLEGTISTQFNKEHNFKVVVKDETGNTTEKLLTVTDNVIRTSADLVEFSKLVDERKKNYAGETVTLVNDLDLSGIEFAPIGSTSIKVFKGTFDGNGHTISNININTDKNNVGLFGYVKDATIKNVGIESGNITSTKDYVAGIVGRATGNTTVQNCYNKANITGQSYIGGIVGEATDEITIQNCYNVGDITANSNSGGIVGIINKGTIQNCYNIGTITGKDNIGEVIGFRQVTGANEDITTASIINCYYLNAENEGIGKTAQIVSDIEILDTTEAISDIDTLLTNLGEEFKADTDRINNSYPILAWENQLIATMKLSRRDAEYVLPINTDYTITSEFGTRTHPVTEKESTMHYGIDIATDWKSEVLAIADGTVTFAGENGGYGYCIEIEHIINGEKVYSFYAHLFEIDVEVGDTVTQGQIIAKVGGMPGTDGAGTSTGPHLHLEIRKTSGSYLSAVDPRNYIEF